MRGNGAVEDGAGGFAEGDEVVVLKKFDSSKVYVVGHVDGIQGCYFKLRIYRDDGRVITPDLLDLLEVRPKGASWNAEPIIYAFGTDPLTPEYTETHYNLNQDGSRQSARFDEETGWWIFRGYQYQLDGMWVSGPDHSKPIRVPTQARAGAKWNGGEYENVTAQDNEYYIHVRCKDGANSWFSSNYQFNRWVGADPWMSELVGETFLGMAKTLKPTFMQIPYFKDTRSETTPQFKTWNYIDPFDNSYNPETMTYRWDGNYGSVILTDDHFYVNDITPRGFTVNTSGSKRSRVASSIPYKSIATAYPSVFNIHLGDLSDYFDFGATVATISGSGLGVSGTWEQTTGEEEHPRTFEPVDALSYLEATPPQPVPVVNAPAEEEHQVTISVAPSGYRTVTYGKALEGSMNIYSWPITFT